MIKDGYKQNFETILDAAANGDLALVECTDKEGRPVITICAIYVDEEGMYNTVPLAKMFDGNPYLELTRRRNLPTCW